MTEQAHSTPALTLAEQIAALDNRTEMLRTLHLAYRDLLDEAANNTHRQVTGQDMPAEERRLSKEEQYDLARRLCLYWNAGRDVLPYPEARAVKNPFNELVAKWAEEFVTTQEGEK